MSTLCWHTDLLSIKPFRSIGSGIPWTGGATARDALSIDGVSLGKTGEVYALENTATISGNAYTDDNEGVFPAGRNVTLSPFMKV